MASESGKLSNSDVRRWLTLALMACIAAVLDVVANVVIPDLSAGGGSLNATIVMVLTLGLDLARRWLTNTNKVTVEEKNSMVVVGDGFVTKMLKKLGFKK